MNKFIFFVLLFIVVFCNNDLEDYFGSMSDEYFYTGNEAISCIFLNINNDLSVEKCNTAEIPDKKYKCCLQSFKEEGEEEEKICMPLKKSKVKDYIKELEKDPDTDDGDLSVDCSSNYLSNILIILLSLFI